MMPYSIISFLIVINIFYSSQKEPASNLSIAKGVDQHLVTSSEIHIENGINRGITYMDSLGNKFNLRYIPITITNNSTNNIEFHLEFLHEYNYPKDIYNEPFKIMPLPREWALDGVEITNSMVKDLPIYINSPSLKTTLEPGKEYKLAIGTLYPRPPRSSGILPVELFVPGEGGTFTTCHWMMEKEPSVTTNPIRVKQTSVQLGLKLKFSDDCMIIPCGQISYPED